jgi:hypothetical protein
MIEILVLLIPVAAGILVLSRPRRATWQSDSQALRATSTRELAAQADLPVWTPRYDNQVAIPGAMPTFSDPV